MNVVPGRSRAELDVRVVRPEDHDAVLESIDRIGKEEAASSGSKFERRVMSDHPPIVGGPSGPDVDSLLRAVIEVTGREPPTGISPFSTDAVSIVPRLAVPVLIYGPGDIARAHRPDEFVELEALHEAFEVFLRFLE